MGGEGGKQPLLQSWSALRSTFKSKCWMNMLQREDWNLILDHNAYFLACKNYEKILQQHFMPLYILVLFTAFCYLTLKYLLYLP